MKANWNSIHKTIAEFFSPESFCCLKTQLRSSPVSSLGVVTDGVVSSQSDPLWQWSVLLLSLGQLLLDSERLLSLQKC